MGPSSASARKFEILHAIVKAYIETGEPVASRSVARARRDNLSPASVRNVMADLCDEGYLAQPHTSAGRVPTDKAYRFYVDAILNMRRLNPEEKDHIEKGLLLQEDPEISEVMKRASHLLSLLSKQMGVVLAPRFGSKIFRHIEFIKLRDRRILVILISQAGEVQNKLIEADGEMSQDELDKYSKYLTEIMGGLNLAQAKLRIVEEMKKEKVLFDKLMYGALQLSQKALEDEGEGDLFIEGKSNIMQSPEFADMEKMRILLQAFEEKTKIVKLLDKALSTHGIQIFIGAENDLNEMVNCSIVAAPLNLT